MRLRRSLPSPKESRTRSKKKDRAASKPQFREHPLFGKVPLVYRPTTIEAVEKSYEVMILDYDLDYAPKLPPGAVRANVHRQARYVDLRAPKCFPQYFYVNESKTCVQCGKDFVFSAHEQKYWYETLKFTFGPVRCRDCRRRRRTEKGLRLELAAAKAALEHAPDDPAALLAVAEALVRYHRRFGQGKLAEAIAAARRAAAPISLLHARTRRCSGKDFATFRTDGKPRAARCWRVFWSIRAAQENSTTWRARLSGI